MDVKPIPGLEHLPYAEVWFHEVDDARWREASAKAHELGKPGLEVWTTDRTPEVADFFLERGYEQVRRYVISELVVADAPDLGPSAFEVVTLGERPELASALYEIARDSYRDQPGRAETNIGPPEVWRSWGLEPHEPEAYFVALDGDEVAGYGFLAEEDGVWTHGFTGVARTHRGRGVAGAIKRAQIGWAKRNGIPALRTATEVRLTGMRSLNRRFRYLPLYEEIVLRGTAASP